MQLRNLPRDAFGILSRSLGTPREPKTYWEARQNARYLQEVRRLVNEVAGDAKSILDVGSNGCGYLDWFPQFERRVSLDLRRPYVASGIESVRVDFFKYEVLERFDIVLCLQVLEHVPDATAFAQRLIASARRHVIISVPYKWPEGRHRDHVHDPVDEAKMLGWLGCEPSYSRVVLSRGWRGKGRLVNRYDLA